LEWTADYLIGPATTEEQLSQPALDFELDPDRIPISVNCLLVRTGDRNVLIDAGLGKRPHPRENEGKLLQTLGSAGLTAGEIDDVIITHSDRDHIGGLLDEEGEPVFPNATYTLSANSWSYWSTEEGRSKIAALHGWPEERIDSVWGTYATVQNRVTAEGYHVEFIPGFRMVPAPGHRYDHDILEIEAAGEKLIHLADSLIHPVMMSHRDWYYSYDVEPERALETKERLLEWCASENALVMATHFPFPGLGHVERRDNRWHWRPTA
jgi:glyoxylase-like metal-dependent hydrolase (beta-lactamase superfamily II)